MSKLSKITQSAADALSEKLQSECVIVIAMVDSELSVGSVTPNGNVTDIKVIIDKVRSMI